MNRRLLRAEAQPEKETMSKGPGKQQRRILAALDKCPAFFLAELCESGTHSEHMSLWRAASTDSFFTHVQRCIDMNSTLKSR